MTWPGGWLTKVHTDQTAKKGCGDGGGNGSALTTIVQAAVYRSSAAKLGYRQSKTYRAQSHADANRSFTRAYLQIIIGRTDAHTRAHTL